jgi:hypothetical protein
MAAHDIDRQVSFSAGKSWTDGIGEGAEKLALDETLLPSLLSFVQRSLLDPKGVYLYLNPPAPVAAAVPSKKLPGRSGPTRDDSELATRTKGEGDDENEQDRKARLRVSAFGALGWVMGRHITYSFFDIPNHVFLIYRHSCQEFHKRLSR